MKPRGSDERGESLVEVLVALAILGIAAVAVLAGLQLSVQASDIHRKQSTGGAYARSYAEAIESYVSSGNYLACAATNAYNVGAVTAKINTLPAGYTLRQEAAVPIDGNGAPVGGAGCQDKGVQRVLLTVSSADGRAEESLTIVLRRPCGVGTSCS